MAVYVDDMNLRAEVPDGSTRVRGTWSHLFADTEPELRAFATKIGLKQSWIQHPGEPHVHFDVAGRMRQRAIAAGATPVTWRQAGEFFAERTQRPQAPVDLPASAPRMLALADGETRPVVRVWPDGAFDCPFCGSPASPGQAGQKGCPNPACKVNMNAGQLAAVRARDGAETAHTDHSEAIASFAAKWSGP